MIEILIFTGVALFYCAVEFCIEYFIFGNAKWKNASSIQTEQRKLLEAHAVLKEIALEAVSPPTQLQHNETITIQYDQEEIYQTASYNTSLVVYNPPVDATSFFPLVYLGSLVGLFVVVLVISKWSDKTDKEQNETISSDKFIKPADSTRTLEECVEGSTESSVEWFDAQGSCDAVTENDVMEEWFDAQGSDVTEDDVIEEWFDAQGSDVTENDVMEEWFDAQGSDVTENDVLEEWLDAECSGVTEDDVMEDCVEEKEKSRNVYEAGVFVVSDEVSSADESEDILIAFGDFSLDQTKQCMETTGFVPTLPEKKKSENHSIKHENKSKKEKGYLVKDEPMLICTFDIKNMDDTSDEKFGISVSKPETLLQDTTPETTVSLNEKEVEGEVKERKEESEKQEKESGIYNFKTDLQISHRMSTARLGRELQKWEPADDEDDEAECLEEEGEDWKEQTIFSAEEMFKLNASIGVQSTFLEDLSQYTTKLDISSLSREQIDFAEKMANEIMKENQQRKNKQRRRNKNRKNNS